ncbi:MAG: glycosyltransferase family A protein [Eubacteriales bacterium]|nr:glycosyltransferase family A protein [Eubacteriales bacterium]
MKLSVIIPVYNAENYITSCLDSVLSQSLTDLEVICVDDASTDRSAEKIQERMKEDPRISLYRNEKNLFAGACRNRGIEHAKGEFLHFLDADDMVMTDVYEKLLNMMEEQEIDVLKGCGKGFCIREDGREEYLSAGPLLELSEVPEEKIGIPFSAKEDPELLSHVSVVPWNGLYRRKPVMENKIRYNSLVCVNDRSFFNEVTLAAERILLVKECLVKYRVNQGESLMGRRAKNFECEFKSYEIVKKQLEKYAVSEEVRREILSRELADVFLWYRRYRNLPEGVGASVRSKTKTFAEELDLSAFSGTEKEASWYPVYCYVTGKEPLMKKVRHGLAGILRNIKGSR